VKNLSDLVEQSIIDSAREKFCASAARLDTTAANLAEKHRAVAAAEATLTAAVRDVASGKVAAIAPDAAQSLVADAERARDLAQRLYEATQQEHQRLVAAHHAAPGLASRPILKFAAAESIAASEDFQAALSALEAAVQRKFAAIETVVIAGRHGAALPFDGGLLQPTVNHFSRPQPAQFQYLLRTPSEEREIWGGLAQ
jgi:hypothetical protein